jgi:hypothetical protein
MQPPEDLPPLWIPSLAAVALGVILLFWPWIVRWWRRRKRR